MRAPRGSPGGSWRCSWRDRASRPRQRRDHLLCRADAEPAGEHPLPTRMWLRGMIAPWTRSQRLHRPLHCAREGCEKRAYAPTSCRPSLRSSRAWVAHTAITRIIGCPGFPARVDLISSLTDAGAGLSWARSHVSLLCHEEPSIRPRAILRLRAHHIRRGLQDRLVNHRGTCAHPALPTASENHRRTEVVAAARDHPGGGGGADSGSGTLRNVA